MNKLRSEIGQLVYQIVVKKNPFHVNLRKKIKKLCEQTHQCDPLTWEPKPAEPTPEPFPDYPLEILQAQCKKNNGMLRPTPKPLPRLSRTGIQMLAATLALGSVLPYKHE